MRVLLVGCLGQMGAVMRRAVVATDGLHIVAGVDPKPSAEDLGFPVFASFDRVVEIPDIVVDFSHPAVLEGLLAYGLDRRVPLLICTTGFSDDQIRAMREVSEKIPVLHSGNMSLGVNLMLALAKTAARVLGSDYDIEIVEKHHNRKADAPSGTALMLADALDEGSGRPLSRVYGRFGKDAKRTPNQLGIHAVRGGNIVGEHSLIFAGPAEIIEIRHSALSRELFALGAIKAMRFLAGRPAGMYSMSDVIESDV